MGQTKKAIKEELKAAFKKVQEELTEAEKRLTKEEKQELKEYIEALSEGTMHTFSPIFIKKKIKDIINKREDISNICEDNDESNYKN